jgi:hypothetical protein
MLWARRWEVIDERVSLREARRGNAGGFCFGGSGERARGVEVIEGDPQVPWTRFGVTIAERGSIRSRHFGA